MEHLDDIKEEEVDLLIPDTLVQNSPVSDSEEFDTDLEDDKEGTIEKERERREATSRQNTDIGHHTYEDACCSFNVIPLRRVLNQLPTNEMQLGHIGLNPGQAKAIGVALTQNCKVEKLDLTDNGLDGEQVAYFFEILKSNIYITHLNLSNNRMDETAAMNLADMLAVNTWLTHLSLAGNRIGDKEMISIVVGLQESSTLHHLDLGHNDIGITGALRLAKAINQHSSLKSLNLSWNHIRAAGGVAIAKSLQKNKSIVELDLSWNGLAFEGSLALGESLKENKTLRKLNINNNRINWDCVPYIGRGLKFNRTLNILEIGYNPLSLEGCADLLEFISNKRSGIQVLSLVEIPINTKIAYLAAKISHYRKFVLHHGGLLTTGDVLGIQRAHKEDPLSRLVAHLSSMGIRVVDLFRMFDTEDKLYVSKDNFIHGLRRIGVPLDDDDMQAVANRMEHDGQISFKALAAGVRHHIREGHREDHRQEMLEKRKRDERKRILQSDTTLNAHTTMAFSPSVYNLYGSTGRPSDMTLQSPLLSAHHPLSRQSSMNNLHKTIPQSASTVRILPRINSSKATTNDITGNIRSGRTTGRRRTIDSAKTTTKSSSVDG